jgi:hypothetical protein
MPDTTINFITLRQPQRINEKVKRLRYIQDIRSNALAPIREQLKGADGIGQELFIAQAFKSTPVFFTPDHYYTLKYETIVDTLRELLAGRVVNRDGSVVPGVEIASVVATLEVRLPVFASSSYFTAPNLPPAVLEGEIPITIGAEYEGKFYFNFLYEMEPQRCKSLRRSAFMLARVKP